MSFEKLQGQDQLRRVLIEELSAETISHAVLLSGPSGSGKRSWALALARALLCSQRSGAEPCQVCLSCRQFDSGNHPAFFYLEPKSRNIKIEQIREIRGRFYFEGANRVCLINQADQMTAEACSSLLKILEDPPQGLYFILLAEQAPQLFSTIVSRCRRFSLQPLRAEEIALVLKRKGVALSEKTELIIRLCKGLPGLALQMAQDPAFEERLREAADLADQLVSGQLTPRELLEQANILAERADLAELLELMYLYYRDGLIRKFCRNKALLAYPVQTLVCSDIISSDALEQVLGLIHSTLKELIFTNVNRRLTVEGLLIQLQRRFSYAQSDRSALPAGR